MTLLEQLENKHINAIFDNITDDHGETLGYTSASTACTQITLQAIVDELKWALNDNTSVRQIGNKIKEIELLIKK